MTSGWLAASKNSLAQDVGAELLGRGDEGAVLTRGGVPGAPELSEEELRTAVEEAAHYGAFVAVHAHGAEGARRAIRAGA